MIILIVGPPFNRTLAEIEWMTPKQIQRLFLSWRNRETGTLDLDMLQAEERDRKRRLEPPVDPNQVYRDIRRMQATPEYGIERELRQGVQYGG